MTDVDNFHLINDYWDYEMGTNILNFILKKLELFPQTLFVNRYHSDIFVGIIDITGQDPAVVREKISAYHKQAIREVLESYPLNYMTLNTGVYYLNDTDTPAEEVISHANIARRRAKETSTCVFEYNAELSSTEQKRAETIHSFQNALAKKEFQIYFQPKISGKTQEIASAEVLVRWLREDGTLWFPDSFLPILEETGTDREAVQHYLLHQANIRILEAASRRLKVPMDKIPVNIERYGNTSAASIPILLDEMHRDGRLKRGDTLVMAGFGAGLTWGAALMTW